jgi:heme-degrading monooxygenase HmoA
MASQSRLLRVFEVRTKPGCVDQLLKSFSTTSADVVKGQPGNKGYFFGKCIHGGDNVVLFVSVWKDLDAVKKRFGHDWQRSYLPNGYEDLIEECSIRHFDVGAGWHV